ncbi:MAG TPA: FHA domain-containing protein [Tepidisphaeraceae bacterium]|nr:FHA domain-containing protein [Tepidisphaeraceae bacterium]
MPIRSVPKSWEGASAPRLIFDNRPDHPVVLSRPVTFIGQRRDAHLRLPVGGVSSLHAIIAIDSSGGWIYDLASRTGTILNGRRVTEARLKSEDYLKIGSATFHYVDSRSGLTDKSPVFPYSIETEDGTNLIGSGRFFSIGRRPGSNWRHESADVSLTHSVICQLDGKLFLRDAGSRSGTHLNGLRVSLVEILPTDLFAIGGVNFHVKSSPQDRLGNPAEICDSVADSANNDPAPALPGRVSPRIDDLSPELLDSLFGNEVSQPEEVANEAISDSASVDWGFLKSAIPTIAADDQPPEDQKPK